MFFHIMRYLPAHLQKHSQLHVPVGMMCVEYTELIPWLKTKSGLEFNESPWAILYEYNGVYHQYQGPMKEYSDNDALVKWLLSLTS
jgi:hypothetical protein